MAICVSTLEKFYSSCLLSFQLTSPVKSTLYKPRVIWEEGTPAEELPQREWLMGMIAGHIFYCWLRWEGPTHCGSPPTPTWKDGFRWCQEAGWAGGSNPACSVPHHLCSRLLLSLDEGWSAGRSNKPFPLHVPFVHGFFYSNRKTI